MTDQLTQERLIYAVSTHWAKYVSRALIAHLLAGTAIILVVIAFVTAPKMHEIGQDIFLVGVLLFFFAHHFFFHKLMSEALLDIIITDERVIYFDDCLLTCDDEHEIPIHKLTGVEVRQHGLIQNFLNYGIVWFDTGGGIVELKRSIPFVPHPDELVSTITELMRRNRLYDSHS
ncbi:hypothetical protein COU78_01365 [Candidatus Peregrinibacteria bacterium CG10_big_fil_rev_8_21_14_0_10_49_24]|nr:MAG: hypothetical protein COV83_04330 [Candidatus Peregrinibacteria bacterium CG11_big_fil_rev_8_21_14_0_20_49_14]PIR51374.1 MAG: hypothetical protein COU78_01365 [Candidatus Peregrinibacteria bacterium CG10_big_fil_rev_8_21_14_0_10_49_24]PJA68138.1 MAG: hypothetical protein CO157_01180 [Candidatus Peregrinibacteria bacterium CG_4_9_14_3_um_filter_49_12]